MKSHLPEIPCCTNCQARTNSVLKDTPEASLQTVSEGKGCTAYSKGAVIFQEGQQPKGLFCIHRGKIKLYKTSTSDRSQIVRFARPGDVIGYRALASGEPYSVSASALDECVVCCIPQDMVFGILKNDDNFLMNIIRLLSSELKQAEERIMHLAQKPVRERVAETLLLLREIYGTENGAQSAIDVTLSREELANVVGTATETLVRTIADFKKESLIATERKKIRILDPKGLISISQLND